MKPTKFEVISIYAGIIFAFITYEFFNAQSSNVAEAREFTILNGYSMNHVFEDKVFKGKVVAKKIFMIDLIDLRTN